ncbi:hypothetical protein PM082_001328 [Marasmius tenuissimus]|nr:hypothetical protein PM082_001328 [Marasmius tenuissimus]
MSILSFRTCRRLIAAFFALAHLASCTLQLVLHAAFTQPAISWILCGLETVIIAWFITAAFIQPILKLSHTVISEIVSSFIMFTLSIVLALIALTAPTKSEELSKPHVAVVVGVWLRILVFTSFAQVAYAFLFFVLSGVVSVTYDRSIWIRNTDGSPSPFSMTILLSFILPSVFKPFNTTYRAALTPQEDCTSTPRSHCVDPNSCSCPPLKHAPLVDDSTRASVPTDINDTGTQPVAAPQIESTLPRTRRSQMFLNPHLKKSCMSLSKSLVEIPDAAQRRMSYPVVLTRWQEDAVVGIEN